MQCLRRPEEVDRYPGNRVTDDCNRWMLELAPGSSVTAASAVNYRDISPVQFTHNLVFRIVLVLDSLACLSVSMLEP